jgi:glutaredoxin
LHLLGSPKGSSPAAGRFLFSKRARPMSQITVYGAEWCHDTQNTLSHLDEIGVPYDFRDIDEDPRALEFVTEHNAGKRKLPTVDVGGRVLSVPDDEQLDEALRGQGIVQ